MRKTSQELGRWHDILQRMQTGADCTAGNSSLDFGYRTTMILSHNAAIFIHAFNHRLAASGEICRNCGLRKFSPRFQGNGWDGQSRSLHRYRLRDFTGKVGSRSGGIASCRWNYALGLHLGLCAHVACCRCLSWRCNARARLTMCHAVEKVSVCRSDCCQA